MAEGITKGRAIITEELIKKWFDELLAYLQEQNATDILDDPCRIMGMKQVLACVQRQAKYLHQRAGRMFTS